MNYKNVAIIGSNGFIGSHLAQKLMLIPTINLHLFGRSEKSLFNNNLPYTQLDIKNNTTFDKIFNNIDIVYYLASSTIPSSSWDSPIIEIENNLIPFIRFMEAIAKTNIKKIVFISSGGTIYGSTQEKVSEDSNKNPFNPHGIIKLTMEYFLNYFNKKNTISFDTYRVANVYGEGQNTKKGIGIINTFLESILVNKNVHIFGDGENIRNYLYVNDLAELMYFSLMSAPDSSEIYNIASNDTISINNLVQIIKKVVPEDFEVLYTPKRQSDNSSIYLDNSKILNVNPSFIFTDIEKGIYKTYLKIKQELNR